MTESDITATFTQETLDSLRNAAYAQQRAERDAREYRTQSMFARDRAVRAGLSTVTRPGTAEDYSRWMTGYVRRGGLPTHYYDYPTPTRNLLVATGELELQPLHGATSVSVIVPAGIRLLSGFNSGHNEVFLMDGFRHNGTVPVYTDTEILEG